MSIIGDTEMLDYEFEPSIDFIFLIRLRDLIFSDLSENEINYFIVLLKDKLEKEFEK